MALTRPPPLGQSERYEGLYTLLDVISGVLEELVLSGEQKPPILNDKTMVFNGVQASDFPIRSYIRRICLFSGCSNECFILMLVYLDRLVTNKLITLTSFNVHRFIITAIMCAAKFFDDQFYFNPYFGLVGGLQPREINTLELEFLFLLRFKLHVTREEYTKYYDTLTNMAFSRNLIQCPSKMPLPLPQEDAHTYNLFLEEGAEFDDYFQPIPVNLSERDYKENELKLSFVQKTVQGDLQITQGHTTAQHHANSSTMILGPNKVPPGFNNAVQVQYPVFPPPLVVQPVPQTQQPYASRLNDVSWDYSRTGCMPQITLVGGFVGKNQCLSSNANNANWEEIPATNSRFGGNQVDFLTRAYSEPANLFGKVETRSAVHVGVGTRSESAALQYERMPTHEAYLERNIMFNNHLKLNYNCSQYSKYDIDCNYFKHKTFSQTEQNVTYGHKTQ